MEEEDENFSYYVLLMRADALKVDLPKKANTILVVLRIPDNVPLLMDIMPKLATLKFEEFDTQMQDRLKRADCMVLSHPDPSGAQVLRPMEWAKGVSCAG